MRCSRSLGGSARLMDEILRHGTQDLFQARTDSDDARTAVQSKTDGRLALSNGVETNAVLREDPENAEAGRMVPRPNQVRAFF